MIAIIDYGVGNLGSIANMFRKIGAEARITASAEEIAGADKLLLPGVGAFDHGIRELRRTGLEPLLQKRAVEDRIPVLGICLGFQLLSKCSAEGAEAGLGWLEAETVALTANGDAGPLKIPHMGWSDVHVEQPDPLFAGLEADARFYFVHSYQVRCAGATTRLASTRYGQDVTAAARHGNVVGVQFHPEKSHRFGMRLLENFARTS